MAQKIEDWIKKRVGLCLFLNSNTIGDKLHNGFVYYNLLRSYNILNEECLPEPKRKCSAIEAKSNLLRLSPWLKLIGINASPLFLKDVAYKSKKDCVKLLMDLYRKLEDSNCIHLITKQMQAHILSKSTDKFTINTVAEPVVTYDQGHQGNGLDRPLLTNGYIIKKYKQHKQMLLDDFKEQLRIRRLKIEETNKTLELALPKIPRKYEPKPRDVGGEGADPIKAFVDSCADRKFSQELFLNCTPQEHVNYLRQKKVNSLANELLRLKMHNMLLHDMWTEILMNNGQDFESFFEERLQQQSEFEKRLSLRLARTHNNYKSFFEQKQLVNDVPESEDCYRKQDTIIKKREVEDEFERMRLLELHHRFKEDKAKKRHEFVIKTCQDIVSDIIDIAINRFETFKATGVSPSKAMLYDYKGLFFKGVPLYTQQDPTVVESRHSLLNLEGYVTEQMTYEDIRKVDNRPLRQRIADETLNNFYTQAYLENSGPWSRDNYFKTEGLEENLNIHGFVVHRLLEFKYSFPMAPEPPKLTHFKIRSFLRNFHDQDFINCLAALLKKSRIAVIRLNDALNYCLQMYEKEKHITPFGRTLKPDKFQSVVTVVDENDVRPTSGEVPHEVKAVGLDGQKAKYFGRRLAYHKAIQCPSVEDLQKRFKHSTPALLGKIAFESLNRGELLNEVLTVKMMVEYLKSLSDEDGFVLVDFPNSVSQAALLEYLITGVPVQINFPMNYDEKEMIFQEMEPPLLVDSRFLVDFEERFADFIHEKTFAAKEKILPMLPKMRRIRKSRLYDELMGEGDEIDTAASTSSRNLSSKRNRLSGIKKVLSKNNSKELAVPDNNYIEIPIYQEREEIEDREPSISLKELMVLRKSKILPRSNQAITPEAYFQKSVFQSCIANITEKTGKENKEKRCSSLFHELLRKSKNKSHTASHVNHKGLDGHLRKTSKVNNKTGRSRSVSILTKSDMRVIPSTSNTQKPNCLQQNSVNKFKKVEPIDQLPTPLILYKYSGIPIIFVKVQGNVPAKKLARLILSEPEENKHPLRRNSVDLFGSTSLEICSLKTKQYRSRSDIDVWKERVNEASKEVASNKQIEMLEVESRDKPIEQLVKNVDEKPKEVDVKVQSQMELSTIDKQVSATDVSKTALKPENGKKAGTTRGSIKNKRMSTSNRRASAKSGPKGDRRQSTKDNTKNRKSSTSRRLSKGSRKSSLKTKKKREGDNSNESFDVKYMGPKPGEEGWVYKTQPVPDKLQVALASLWEIVEHVYLRNIRSVFEIIGIHNEKLSPIRAQIRTILNEYLEAPDDKLNIVSNFQLMLNTIDNDFRKDAHLKVELHYKVNELQEILNNLIRQNYENANKQLQSVLSHGWEYNFCYPLINHYYEIIGTEFNRYADTLVILGDYYTAMLKGKLDESKIEKLTLPKLMPIVHSPPQDEQRESVLMETDSEIHLRKFKRKRTQQNSKHLEEYLMMEGAHIANVGFLNNSVESSLAEASSKAKQIQSRLNETINDENTGKELRLQLDSKDRGEVVGKAGKANVKAAGSKKDVSSKTSDTNPSGSDLRGSKHSASGGERRQSRKKSTGGARRQSQKKKSMGGAGDRRQSKKKSAERRQSAKKSNEGAERRQSQKASPKPSVKQSKGSLTNKPDDHRKKNTRKEMDLVEYIKMEWSTAVQNELDRLLFRVKLIECKLKDDISDVFHFAREGADFFEDEIKMRHDKEIEAVKDLCLVLKAAIEDETPIQPLLVLDKGKFYIDRSNLLFADSSPSPPKTLVEAQSDGQFSIKQLEHLLSKLSFISPCTLVQESFISIVEDMVLKSSNNDFRYLPAKWDKLKRSDVELITLSAFGYSGIIQWRNFILFNLDIPLPKLANLLELKERYMQIDTEGYETITFEQYMDVPMWFDKDFGASIYEDLRLALVKELLFKIFQVNQKEMNYSNMLLAFCKDEDAFEGFMMALILFGSNKIMQDKDCSRAADYPQIEALLVVKHMMEDYAQELCEGIDTYGVNVLLPHTNEQIYGSPLNEYLITEQLMAFNEARVYSSEVLVDDTTAKKADPTDCLPDVALTGIYLDSRWKVCVPYKLALMLFMVDIHLYGISPDHLHRQIDLEKKLRQLFENQGKDGYIKAFNLVDNDLFRELFLTVPIYKWCDIDKVVDKCLAQKELIEIPVATQEQQ